MNEELAREIVKNWDANPAIIDVPGLFDHVKETGVFWPFKMRLKTFLGAANRAAADALWDGKPVSAIKALLRYDVIEKLNTYHPQKTDYYITNPRRSGKFTSPKTDWRYVKPVRSK
jgi:hypothetical protein